MTISVSSMAVKSARAGHYNPINNSGIIAVVSHDAGGAELLASYIEQNNLSCRLILEGPAVNIFKRRFGTFKNFTLTEGIASCDWCLCGSGSNFEWNAIKQAQRAGKHVVTFLDHWMNYPERFIRNDVQYLPDEIWVGDKYAEKLAFCHFSNILIRLVPNPYFIELKHKITDIGVNNNRTQDERNRTALFVSENLSSYALQHHADERYWGYTELDAIEYLLENLNVLNTLGSRIKRVLIRPHPSDHIEKYNQIISKNADIVQLSNGGPLLKEVVEADLVVGCQSMAMVVGLLAKKIVVSCIPPNGRKCCLPHKNILHLGEMVNGGLK